MIHCDICNKPFATRHHAEYYTVMIEWDQWKWSCKPFVYNCLSDPAVCGPCFVRAVREGHIWAPPNLDAEVADD